MYYTKSGEDVEPYASARFLTLKFFSFYRARARELLVACNFYAVLIVHVLSIKV